MALTKLIDYKDDLCYGDSDPNGQTDTFNRPGKEVWGYLTPYTGTEGYGAGTGEHIKTGVHMDDLDDNLWVVEDGNYTGDGADDTDIALSDSGLDIKAIRIWDANIQYTWFRTEDIAGDNSKDTNNSAGFTADYIQSVATTGQFQVGTSLNVNLREYYYVVYGVS